MHAGAAAALDLLCEPGGEVCVHLLVAEVHGLGAHAHAVDDDVGAADGLLHQGFVADVKLTQQDHLQAVPGQAS